MNIIGVGDQLTTMDKQEKELYNERLYVGRTADQKKKYTAEQPYYPDTPEDLISASELIRQQQAILLKNAENQRKRDQVAELAEAVKTAHQTVESFGCTA